MDEIDRLLKEIREHEDQLYCMGNNNRKCVHRLECAHMLRQVFKEEETTNGLWIVTLWVVEGNVGVPAEKGVKLRSDYH